MKCFKQLWVLVYLVVLACGDSGAEPVDAGGSATTDAASVDAGSEPMEEDAGKIMGGCDNESDRGHFNDDAIDEVAEAETCGLRCVGSRGDLCAVECIRERTEVSELCSVCLSIPISCAIENCLPECVEDPGAPQCEQCMCGANPASVDCFALYSQCAGIQFGTCE